MPAETDCRIIALTAHPTNTDPCSQKYSPSYSTLPSKQPVLRQQPHQYMTYHDNVLQRWHTPLYRPSPSGYQEHTNKQPCTFRSHIYPVRSWVWPRREGKSPTLKFRILPQQQLQLSSVFSISRPASAWLMVNSNEPETIFHLDSSTVLSSPCQVCAVRGRSLAIPHARTAKHQPPRVV